MENDDAPLTIQLATSEDAAAMLTLLRQLVTESDTFTVDPGLAQLSVAEEQRQIMLINQTRSNVILVAHFAQQLIGIVTVQQLADSTAGEVGIAVLKQFWNHGVGSALLDEAVNWGLTFSNLQQLVLTVAKQNSAAIHIYHKLGFLDQSHRRLIPVPGSERSTIEMIYPL